MMGMEMLAMDPPAVRGLALVLRLQSDVADEAAARINSALVLAGLTSEVSNRLVGRAEDWRLAAGVLETRATLAESFRIDLVGAPAAPGTVLPTRSFSPAEQAAQQDALDDVVNMTEGERAVAVAAMSDEELAALVDFANFSGQSDVVAGVLLPVIDDDRSASWSDGLPGVDSIADLNDRIENWQGTDNDPILDQLIAERTALIEALTNDDQTWNYDPEIAAFAELYGFGYDRAALILDANEIATLTLQIDGLAGMPGPVLDSMVAERQTLIDGWLGGETFPPEIAAVILPLLGIPEIVEVERQFPGTVDIGRLNAVLAEHDANWHPPQIVDPEIEELRALRNALVADVAGQDTDLGLDPNIAALAQVNGVSYQEAEVFLIIGEVGRLNHSIAAVGDGPVADAMIAERNALLERVTESDAASASILGGLLDDGFPLEEAVMVMAAADANELDFGAIADLARSEGISLIDATEMTMSASIYATTPDELMAYQGFREHFSVIDNATGGETDDGVSLVDLRYVVEHPSEFDVEVVAAATAFLANPSLRHRIDSALEHSDVVNPDGSFGGTRYDDGFFTLADLDAFETKQTISFLVGDSYDEIDVAHQGGATDGFLSKHDFEDFLETNRADLSEEDIWALETVIAAELYDQGWVERNKHALALAAAIVAGAAFVFVTGGLGTGLSGTLITVVAAGGAGATAAGATTLTINTFSSESDWDDDLLANSFDGFFAGAGSGGAVVGVTGFAAMGTVGQAATGLGLVSDVTGLAGLGAFDLGLQYAVHPEDLDEIHDLANRISLVTGAPALAIGGLAGGRYLANRYLAASGGDAARALLHADAVTDPILLRQVQNEILSSSDQFIDDVARVGVSAEDIALMRSGQKPLGFNSVEQFTQFNNELDEALAAAGLLDAEVGLKGTATTFYSENPGKPLGHHWDANPLELGDFDLNLTSATMLDRFAIQAVEPHEVYNVFRTSDMMATYPELAEFAERWGSRLGRDVNFVGYPEPAARDATEYLLAGGHS